MDVVVGVPFTERGVLKLTKLLYELVSSYNNIALPLPSSLCFEVVVAPSRVPDIVFKYMNRAQFRVWSSLLMELPKLADKFPDLTVTCYLSDESYKSVEELGYKIASLVVKARVFGKIDVAEWLELFRPSLEREVNVGDVDVLVADGYSWTIRAYMKYNVRRLKAVEKLIPTPLDILELVAHGYLEPINVEDIISHAVKYVGEYIVRSQDLTEAYDKLAGDEDYKRLLEKLKIRILE